VSGVEIRWTVISVKVKVRDLLGSLPSRKDLLTYIYEHYRREFHGEIPVDLSEAEYEFEHPGMPVNRFRRRDGELHLGAGQVLGWLKEAVSAAGLSRKVTTVWKRAFVKPKFIPLGRREADRVVIRPIRKGRTSALVTSECIDEVEFEFELWSTDHDFIENFPLIAEYMRRVGLGPGRHHQEYGRVDELGWEMREEVT